MKFFIKILTLTCGFYGISARAQIQDEAGDEARQRYYLEPNSDWLYEGGGTFHMPRILDADVNLDAGAQVEFSQHFKQQRGSENQMADAVACVLFAGAGTVSLATSLKLSRMAEDAKFKLQGDGYSKTKRLILKVKSSKLHSRLAATGGLYLLADSTTGIVIAMLGHEPVYFVNMPALASYVVREVDVNTQVFRQNLEKELPPVVADQLNEMKSALLGKHRSAE